VNECFFYALYSQFESNI